jgi:uncharacterized protein YraI
VIYCIIMTFILILMKVVAAAAAAAAALISEHSGPITRPICAVYKRSAAK